MGPFGPGVATIPEPRGWNERCRLAQRTVHRPIDQPLTGTWLDARGYWVRPVHAGGRRRSMRWRIGPGVLAATAASILMSAAVATAQSSPPPTSADPGLDAALGAIELMNRVPVGIRETCRTHRYVHRGHGDRGRMHRRRRHRVLLAVHRRRSGPGRLRIPPRLIRHGTGHRTRLCRGRLRGRLRRRGRPAGRPRPLPRHERRLHQRVDPRGRADPRGHAPRLGERLRRPRRDVAAGAPRCRAGAPPIGVSCSERIERPNGLESPGAAEPSDPIGERAGGVRGRGAAPMGELCECQLGVRR